MKKNPNGKPLLTRLWAAALLACAATGATGQTPAPYVQVVAGSNSSTLGTLGPALLDDTGTTYFGYSSASPDEYDVDAGDGETISTLVVAPAFPVSGQFINIEPYVANNAGEIAFIGAVVGDTATQRIFTATKAGVAPYAGIGDSAPGGGMFSSFGNLSLNDAGEIAFYATTTGGPGSGIYHIGANGLQSVVLAGDNAPDIGSYASFESNPLVNNRGEILFVASVLEGVAPSSPRYYLASRDGVKLFYSGDTVHAVNNADDFLLFGSALTLVRNGKSTVIVALNMELPGNVVCEGVTASASLNDAGNVAFIADIRKHRPGGQGLLFGSGLYLWTPYGITQIATTLSPLGDGTQLTGFLEGVEAGVGCLLNNENQIVFTGGSLSKADAPIIGLYFWNGAKVEALIQTGDSFEGGQVSAIAIQYPEGDQEGNKLSNPAQTALNDLGQVACSVTTFNPATSTGNNGIYVFNGGPAVLSTFASYAGVYAGLCSTQPLSAAAAGQVNLTLLSSGAFTASVTFGGVRYAARGMFAEDGTYSGGLANSALTLSLKLEIGSGQISGSLTNGTITAQVLCEMNPFNAKSNPCPNAGKYTFQIPPPAPGNAPEPLGSGVATAIVAASGLIACTGTLADGTKLSIGGWVAASGGWSFYSTPYRGKGLLTGRVVFEDVANTSDADGPLVWVAPPVATGPYNAGFETVVAMIGSAYLPPVARQRVLGFLNVEGNGQFTASDGGLGTPLVEVVTLSSANAVTPLVAATDRLKLSIVLSTGGISGSFVPAGETKPINMSGVAFQKQNTAMGYFLNAGRSGGFVLAPNPAFGGEAVGGGLNGDKTLPVVAIKTPTPNAKISGASQITFTGTASDRSGIQTVECQVLYQGAISQLEAATGTTSWSFNVTPTGPGVYTVFVQATDMDANPSTIVARSVTLLP